MEIERSLRKAEHLLNQDRFGEAQNEIKNYLASNPEDISGLIILVQTHLGLGQHEKADQIADDILKIEASDPVVLYLKGVTLANLHKRKESLKFLDNVLAFDPMFVEAYGLKAAVLFELARFEEAVEAARAGLEIDPENEMCLNNLSRSLLKLGQTEQHIEADKQALKNNPMNSNTHATVGFSELEKGNVKKAKEHFREALRLDPNNEYAKGGMIHAIKATNLYYRLFLKYIFWMQGLRPQVRWAVIIIGYLLIQGLSKYSDQLGSISAFAEIIITLYIIFAISTWIIGPVSNIFLRFNSFGKYLLEESEIKTANIAATLLGLSVVGTIIMFNAGEAVQWHNLGLYLLCSGIAMTVVFSSIENAVLEKSKRNLKLVGAIFGIACVVLVVSAVVLPGLAFRLFTWIIYGFIGYQFYANSQQ